LEEVKLSLDFKDADIRDVLRGVGVQYNLNIWLSPEVTGRIPVHFSNIKVKDAVAFIIGQYGFEYRVRNGIVEVYKPKAPEAPPAEVKVEIKDSLLTVDIKDAPVEIVVRKISTLSKLNIILEKGAAGTLTGMLKDIPLTKGLRVLMESNGYQIRESSGIMYVTKQKWEGAGENKGQTLGSSPTGGGGGSVVVKDSLVTLELNNTPISTVIDEIVNQSGLNIFVYGKVEGNITAKVSNLPIDDALSYILKNSKNYTYWKTKGIYFLGEPSIQQSSNSEMIPLKNLKADQVVELLPKTVSTVATIKVIKEHNSLMVIGPYDIITAARDYIAIIDKPVAQILIEAMVVDFSVDRMREIGAKFFLKDSATRALGQSYFPAFIREYTGQSIKNLQDRIGVSWIVNLPTNFTAQLRAMESEGYVDIVSTPQIATLNGNAATITISKTFYYRIKQSIVSQGTGNPVVSQNQDLKSVETKTSLSVTPWVTASREVTVEVKPVFQLPGEQPNDSTPPTIDTRELSSTIRLKDGETYILGGLVQNIKSENMSKVPFLGSIPFIGWLFRTRFTSTKKSQLMIFLTPHVYYGSEGAVDKNQILGKENRKWWE
jgi:type II secretory pathway component GspD/PulD (secretin)